MCMKVMRENSTHNNFLKHSKIRKNYFKKQKRAFIVKIKSRLETIFFNHAHKKSEKTFF